MHDRLGRRDLGRLAAVAGTAMLGVSSAASRAAATEGAAAMIRPLLSWMDSLSAAQRRQAVLTFEAKERTDWHYVPRNRPGLALRDMDQAQRRLVWALLEALLSDAGAAKARGVLQIEAVLAELTGNWRFRDPENYALVVFGDLTQLDQPVGWRFEGHHLSLTVVGHAELGVAVTPAFFGANPAVAPAGHRHAGLRILAREQELGFGPLNSLDQAQRNRAVLGPRSLGDIVSGPGRERSLRQAVGVPYAALTAEQQQAVLRLLDTYVGAFADDLAEAERAKIRSAGLENLHFAWAGSQTPDAPHYYRLHGPTTVVEYDNTQNGANHIHTVWHDLTDLFGEDLLQRHHDRDHR